MEKKSLAKAPENKFIDAHELDKKIPSGLIMNYQGKPFILKAGLEWKANQLFGIGKWSMETEIVNYEPEKKYALVKGRVRVNDVVYEDYGEASTTNVTNTMMHKYILHLAVTRAGNRALRRATACGLTSYEELGSEDVEVKVEEHKEIAPGKVLNPPSPTTPDSTRASLKQQRYFYALGKEHNISANGLKERAKEKFNLATFNDITSTQIQELIAVLENKPKEEVISPDEVPDFEVK